MDNQVELDKEGFLKHLDQWNEQVAEQLATAENIALTPQHWEIIHLLREFYKNYQLSPAMRPMVAYVRQNLGETKGKSIYLLKLFPGSPAKIASKIAGLPKPDNCL